MNSLYLLTILVDTLAEWIADHAVAVLAVLCTIIIALMSAALGALGFIHKALNYHSVQLATISVKVTKLDADFSKHVDDDSIHVTAREMSDIRDSLQAIDKRIAHRLDGLESKIDRLFDR